MDNLSSDEAITEELWEPSKGLRRKSCPVHKLINTAIVEYSPSCPDRPSSSCGYYDNNPELSENTKSKFLTRSTELLGSFRTSMKKYTRNKLTEVTVSSEPKIPNVMKSYKRGVSQDSNGGDQLFSNSRRGSIQQQQIPEDSTVIF